MLLTLLVLLFSSNLYSQCTNCVSQYPSATQSINAGQSNIDISTLMYGGDYAICNVVVGDVYTWSTCGSTAFDTQITVREDNGTCTGSVYGYNDDFCSTQSQVTWTATFTGTVRVLISKYNCLNQSSYVTLKWSRSLPPCTTPTKYTVSGGSTICPGGNVAITLSNSQVGVNYQLKRAGSNVGTPIAGTNSAISFPNQSTAGTYTVEAIGTGTFCTTATTMNGSAIISVNTNSTAASSINGPASTTSGSIASYTLIGGSLGTGASWKWYTGSCGGALVHTGTSYSPTINTTTTYYVRAEGTCNTTDCITITTTTEESCDMIYVDATNGNDLYQGLPNAPVKSLTKAITLVSPSRNYIKMTTGTYSESSIINLQDDLVIDGRYTNTAGVWSKSSNTTASTSITLSGTETINANVAHVMGFKSDGKSNWKLIDLNITTENAAGQTTSRRGKSNYVVYIANGSINYEITRCSITSGNATDGQGRNTDATLFDGKNGMNGAVGNTGNGGGSSVGYDAGGSGGAGGFGGIGGANSTIIGGSATSGSTGGKGGSGRNDDNTGGGTGAARTGTCTVGGGALGDNDSGNDDTPYGRNGSDCTTNGTAGTNATSTTVATHTSGFYLPGIGANGTSGNGGGGGAGGGGGGRDTGSANSAGGGGSGGSGGGGGGGGGAGGLGGGSSYGVFIWNAGTGGTANSSIINTGVFGAKGTGGIGGNGGNGGAISAQGNTSGDGQSNRGGKGGAGSNGGKGGNGADGTDGERIAIAVKGTGVNPMLNTISPAIAVNSSTSGGSVTNTPIVSLNQIPNKICQNSVLNVTTSTASWTLPSNWEFVKYNNTAVTSEFTNASTTADITTTNASGFYDVTANGVVFKSYLNVKSTRTLPVISYNPSPACDASNVTLSATSWGTENEYKWEIFDATNAPNKGGTTNLVFASSAASPTTNLLTANTTTPKTYLIRYQVKEACCGWSVPVFETITVNPSVTPAVAISASPNTNICIGTKVTFTAVPTLGGSAPTYQWKVNGTNVGTNSANFASSSLTNSDQVSCVMTSNLVACLSNANPNSNTITMSMPVAGSPLSGTETATCIVNGNDWVRFYGSTGLLLGAINAQNDNLGLVEMKTLVGSPMVMEACGTSNPLYHTAYMGRRWIMTSDVYTTGSDFTNNILVRLPYNDTELAALNNTAETVTTVNQLDGGIANPANRTNLMLTKITGATENGIANSADCASTIRGINTNSGSGTSIQSIANTQYVDFSIGQFSEFFLHKNINNSPLPVTLISFSATCDKQVSLNWTTASEQNSDRFIIEKSRDAQNWSLVSEQTAAGNSSTIINYSAQDFNSWNGITYYRLRQIDYNGEENMYGPISTSCEGSENSLTVFPNPNNGSFTIEISSDKTHTDVQLYITDMTGKVISSQKINLAVGTTQIVMENMDIQMGTYLVTLRGADQKIKPVKVMVTK